MRSSWSRTTTPCDETFRRRFDREARIAQTVQHPNVVPVLTTGEHDGLPYMAQRFIEGMSLDDKLKRDGPLDVQTAVRVCTDVAAGLEVLLGAGMVHRDVKPANILLDESGRAFITDFGLAKDTQGSLLTLPGQALGSMDYMAPEQDLRGAGQRGHRHLRAGLRDVPAGGPRSPRCRACGSCGRTCRTVARSPRRPPRDPGAVRGGLAGRAREACRQAASERGRVRAHAGRRRLTASGFSSTGRLLDAPGALSLRQTATSSLGMDDDNPEPAVQRRRHNNSGRPRQRGLRGALRRRRRAVGRDRADPRLQRTGDAPGALDLD